MKNLLKKQLLLAFVVVLSLFYGLNMLAADDKASIPFNAEYQEMLDDVVKKLNVGNPGDYEGYTISMVSYFTFNVPSLAKTFTKDKKIYLDRHSLYTLSKDEVKFLLGRQVGDTLPNMDQKYVVEQAFARAYSHHMGFSFLGTLVGACPAAVISIRNGWSNVMSMGVSIVSGIAGGLIFPTVAHYCGFNAEAYITLALQKREFELDEKVVEKLDCHEAAINYISKQVYPNVPAAKTIPSNKDRIARIQKLIEKKKQ